MHRSFWGNEQRFRETRRYAQGEMRGDFVLDNGFRVSKKRALWWRARNVKMAWPPVWRQRIPERFIRSVASVFAGGFHDP